MVTRALAALGLLLAAVTAVVVALDLESRRLREAPSPAADTDPAGSTCAGWCPCCAGLVPDPLTELDI